MTTTAVLSATEAKALANIGNGPRDADKEALHFPGFTPNPDATAADFEVGQLVSIFSRNLYRLAVIEKVGRKNVTVVYTTQGATTEALRIREHTLAQGANAEAIAEETRQAWLQNWDYSSGPVTDRYSFHNDEDHARRVERHAAEAATFLEENPDREAFAAAAYQRRLDEIVTRYEAAIESPTTFAVNFTRKSEAFAKVGVRA